MVSISEHFPLKNYNTFGVDVKARFFTEVVSVEDLRELFSVKELSSLPLLVLGGGSNMLLTKDFEGLVVKVGLKGIQVEERDDDDVWIEVGSGEVWKDLVNFCVNRNYAGIENLSLIPGSVGAAPMQNIGAYGVELKDIFHSLRAFELVTEKVKEFSKEDCEFGYRESAFKGKLKGKYIITSVTLRLSKTPHINTKYGAIEDELRIRGIAHPTIKDVSDVVSHIRVAKLPDPSTIGNAGSFFKNPVISNKEFHELEQANPDIVNYPAGNGKVKLAAGWLIEQCGWKGKVAGNTGTWKNQALVIVNHGAATGKEIYDFSEQIIQSVKNKFGITLEREVNVL